MARERLRSIDFCSGLGFVRLTTLDLLYKEASEKRGVVSVNISTDAVCLSVCLSIYVIGNYGVALRRTCYTIFYIVPWCPAVYKTSTASIQSIGFTVTGISFCSSELLISFACDLELLR